MLKECLQKVRKTHPLVHCITNYVTVNDCANILLACGGSPIMADDIGEVEEITALCNALVLNIGTLNERTIASMLAAGKRANQLGRPVVLDPVGAGASSLRTNTAKKLLQEIQFSVIRGNSSEIKTLAEGVGGARGVDAAEADAVTGETLEDMISLAKAFSARTGAVVAITGAIDIVADQARAYVIHNGSPLMANITGCGCMLTGVIGAYCAANPQTPLEGTAAAVCAMGLCGERAASLLSADQGNATCRNFLIDQMSLLDGAGLEQGAKYEIR